MIRCGILSIVERLILLLVNFVHQKRREDNISMGRKITYLTYDIYFRFLHAKKVKLYVNVIREICSIMSSLLLVKIFVLSSGLHLNNKLSHMLSKSLAVYFAQLKIISLSIYNVRLSYYIVYCVIPKIKH